MRRLTRLMVVAIAFPGMAWATDYNADFMDTCGNDHDGVAVEFASNVTFVATDNYFVSTHNGQQYGTNLWNFEQDGGDVGVLNPKISWTATAGQQIHAGDSVHLGFSTDVPQVKVNTAAWLIKMPNSMPPAFGEDDSCGPSGIQIMSLEIHTKGKTIEFRNDPPSRTDAHAQPMYLSGLKVEYYKSHQRLKTLNAYTARNPIRVDKPRVPTGPVPPRHSVTVSFDPPPEARYAVFAYNTDTCRCPNRPPMSRAWAEFPLHGERKK